MQLLVDFHLFKGLKMIFSSYSTDTARSRTYGSWVCGALQCGLVGYSDGKRSNKGRDYYIMNTPRRRLNRHQRKRWPSQGLLPSCSSLAKSQKYLTMHFLGFVFPTAVKLPHGANRGRCLVRHSCNHGGANVTPRLVTIVLGVHYQYAICPFLDFFLELSRVTDTV